MTLFAIRQKLCSAGVLVVEDPDESTGSLTIAVDMDNSGQAAQDFQFNADGKNCTMPVQTTLIEHVLAPHILKHFSVHVLRTRLVMHGH